MNAVDRYLKHVGCWMLPNQRSRVLQRVREDIEEIIGDECEETKIEQRLRQFGPPPVVAARYADYPHVIPGMLAPAYFMVILITLAALFLVNLTLLIPRAIHGESWLSNLGLVLATSFSAAPWAFTVITIVFALLGYWAQRRAHHPRSQAVSP
ncbi:hypothetical protein [Stenotrophomonas sp. Y-13]|uniref:hypothetical protein n=1 Tax=Stenotrophomonas sp. Y-13 TaxID=3384161 RepID=UPI003917121C